MIYSQTRGRRRIKDSPLVGACDVVIGFASLSGERLQAHLRAPLLSARPRAGRS
jgi:hypothetical protein